MPTNTIVYNGNTVKTRIDPSLSVQDVLKQLCVNVGLPSPPADYALRDDNADELVTDDNLRRKIKAKAKLKCVCFLNSACRVRVVLC